jgi:hypothetical protein
VLFGVKSRIGLRPKKFKSVQALLVATWYSISAPLSWLIIFKPTSIIHDAIFPIIWQMPFTLLGFALCGSVLSGYAPFVEKIIGRRVNNFTSKDT